MGNGRHAQGTGGIPSLPVTLLLCLVAIALGFGVGWGLGELANGSSAKGEGQQVQETIAEVGDRLAEGVVDETAGASSESEATQDAAAKTEAEDASQQDEAASQDAAPGAPSVDPHSNNVGGLRDYIARGEPFTIYVIGDSLTSGNDTDSSEWASDSKIVVYQDGFETKYETPYTAVTWANEFRRYLLDKVPGTTFVNAGVGGYRMSQLASNPGAWVPDYADVIVVMLGTNDADYDSIDTYTSNATAALTQVAAHCQHMVVVAPPNNTGTLIPNHCELFEIRDALHDICVANDWEMISLYDAINPNDSDQVLGDHVHPTEAGARMLFEAFKERLNLPA